MIIAAVTFALASTTFKPNRTMPIRTIYPQCGGTNVSPELHWRGAPKRTRGFAIVAHDPDAPAPGGWYHWVVYDLPASTHELVEGATLPANTLGKNSFGSAGYGGPCPPPGKPHHYNFTLYALDTPAIPGTALTGLELERALSGHVLAKTTLTGLYQAH
ncbi:MAG TPA: YbhB/YbcL family Raf kinase inhibitor-like protein [Candidatus Baltobacteraceae bacterium]|nr:YbhB/YbcL family Raf kinase inhibitor-like protein [Candidatus Baltobacteraceae bacterium]